MDVDLDIDTVSKGYQSRRQPLHFAMYFESVLQESNHQSANNRAISTCFSSSDWTKGVRICHITPRKSSFLLFTTVDSSLHGLHSIRNLASNSCFGELLRSWIILNGRSPSPASDLCTHGLMDTSIRNLPTKALFSSQKIFYSARHIEFFDTCMKH